MKKHIFGFVLFSLIVVSTVFVYAFFTAPAIPQIEVVKQPVVVTDNSSSCRRKKPKKPREIKSEILSSQFDLDSNKLISKVKLTWNGDDVPPRMVYLNTHLFTLENDEKGLFDTRQVLSEPFKAGNEAILVIESEVRYDLSIDPKKHLYGIFDFSENGFSESYDEGNENLNKAKQILFVHGENSQINPLPKNKETVVSQ